MGLLRLHISALLVLSAGALNLLPNTVKRYSQPRPTCAAVPAYETGSARRSFLARGLVSSVAALSFPASLLVPDAALASGGATAGKYTTIPIAKRRYYGRVQQAVHEFLLLGPSIVKGDLQSAPLVDFFDPQGIVVVEGLSFSKEGRKTCLKKADGGCKGEEVRPCKAERSDSVSKHSTQGLGARSLSYNLPAAMLKLQTTPNRPNPSSSSLPPPTLIRSVTANGTT